MAFEFVPDADPRYRVIDTQMDVLRYALDRKNLAAALGDEKITRLKDILDMMFVPNVENHTLTIPKELRAAHISRKLIPMFVLSPQEAPFTLQPALRTMHDEQIVHSKDYLATQDDPDSPEEIIHKINHLLYFSSDERSAHNAYSTSDKRLAEVISQEAHFEIAGNDVGFLSRPLILFNTNKQEALNNDVSTSIHELIHVDQTLEHPVKLANDERTSVYTQEIEAYYIQHLATVALKLAPHGTAQRVHAIVEKYRDDSQPNPLMNSTIKKAILKNKSLAHLFRD